MRSRETSADLAAELAGLLLRQAPDPPQKRSQVFAVDMFHGKKRAPLTLTQVVDAAYVEVRDPARNLDFVPHARHRNRIIGHLRRQELERNRLLKPLVLGTVDFSHRPSAQLVDNPVTPGKNRPRLKCH